MIQHPAGLARLVWLAKKLQPTMHVCMHRYRPCTRRPVVVHTNTHTFKPMYNSRYRLGLLQLNHKKVR
jgi:hypothetical protein